MDKMEREYTAVFHKAEEGGFWVSVMECPGCVSQGETEEEALAMIKDALYEWLAAGGEVTDPKEDDPDGYKIPITPKLAEKKAPKAESIFGEIVTLPGENIAPLAKMMNANPNTPVIPLVTDSRGKTFISSISDCYLDEAVEYNGGLYLKRDGELELIMYRTEFGDVSEEEVDEAIGKKIAGLPWEKVIVCKSDLADGLNRRGYRYGIGTKVWCVSDEEQDGSTLKKVETRILQLKIASVNITAYRVTYSMENGDIYPEERLFSTAEEAGKYVDGRGE